MEIPKEEEEEEIKLSEQEEKFYQIIFDTYSSVEGDRSTAVMTNSSIKSLFIASGLEQRDLADIWNIAADKKKKHMEKKSFFLALKLIALRQNGKLIKNREEELCLEQPLPKFQKVELRDYYQKPEKKEEDKHNFFSVKIVSTEYVKSGIFGMNSYTSYKVETRSNAIGYSPTKKYVVSRRYSDFDWLNQQLREDEKLKGFVIPKIADKKLIGNTSEDFVEKRKQELQLFLDLLAKHHAFRQAKVLKLFLTCEDIDEFQAVKGKSGIKKDSMIITSLKNLQIKDTCSIAYTMLKARLFMKEEPADVQSMNNLDDIVKNIDKFLPLLVMMINSLEGQISFHKKCSDSQKEIADVLFSSIDDSEGFNSGMVQKKGVDFYKSHNDLVNVHSKYDLKLLNEIKEEKMNLEGIKNIIAARKLAIENYNAASEFLKSKADRLLSESDVKIEEEFDKIKREIDSQKEAILKINQNLASELENYKGTRIAKLNRIMGYRCSLEKQKAIATEEFLLSQRKELKLDEWKDIHINEDDGCNNFGDLE